MDRSRTSLRSEYVSIPRGTANRPLWRKIAAAFYGCAASLPCWLGAHSMGTPGLEFHRRATAMGIGLLVRRKAPLDLNQLHSLIFAPVVLTRYFEFAFAWEILEKSAPTRYLDVSSPCAFPLLMLHRMRELHAELVNPDRRDLLNTSRYVDALGIRNRCGLHDCLIEEAPFEPASFDAITSLSVIEHIPDVQRAVRKIWNLLRPGGKLVITVPCAREASALYVDRNEYGLLAPDERGFVFLEYIFDEELLARDIFCVTGKPASTAIYGEKRAGFLRNELLSRWSGYPPRYWLEPIMMGREFRRFDRISELPGEGVIGLEFVKP